MVAVDEVPQPAHRPADPGRHRAEYLVPYSHGDVEVGQAVGRAPGQRAADHQPPDALAVLAQLQQSVENCPLSGEFGGKLPDPVPSPQIHAAMMLRRSAIPRLAFLVRWCDSAFAFGEFLSGWTGEPGLAPRFDAGQDSFRVDSVLHQELAEGSGPEQAFDQSAQLLVMVLRARPGLGWWIVTTENGCRRKQLLAGEWYSAHCHAGCHHADSVNAC